MARPNSKNRGKLRDSAGGATLGKNILKSLNFPHRYAGSIHPWSGLWLTSRIREGRRKSATVRFVLDRAARAPFRPTLSRRAIRHTKHSYTRITSRQEV